MEAKRKEVDKKVGCMEAARWRIQAGGLPRTLWARGRRGLRAGAVQPGEGKEGPVSSPSSVGTWQGAQRSSGASRGLPGQQCTQADFHLPMAHVQE